MTEGKVDNALLESLESSQFDVNDSLSGVRDSAWGRALNLPFPTSRTEQWKYTRVNKIINTPWKVTGASDGTSGGINVDSIKISITNGKVVSIDDSNIEGLSIVDLATDQKAIGDYKSLLDKDIEKDVFEELSLARFGSWIVIHVKKGFQIEKPIQIVSTASEQNVALSRVSIIAEENSKVEVIQEYPAGANSFTNTSVDIDVKENAEVVMNNFQELAQDQFQINTQNSVLASNSRFTSNTYTLGVGWCRNNAKSVFNGQNGLCELNGYYSVSSKGHVDNHTYIDHAVPHCESHELYKGVLTDKSTGVFNGKVMVRPDAQKTNAFQSNASILLSEDATINAKPELEIYADDVKCSHGSTTGQLDEEAYFYLRSRGIPADKAKGLLVNAFASEVIDKIKNEALREYIQQKMLSE